MDCTLEIEEICDDGSGPEEFNIEMKTMLDTNQGAVAKEVIGYEDNCKILCNELRKVLNEYP